MEYLWDTKARVIIGKNRADCLEYLLQLPEGRRPLSAVGGRDTIPGEFPHMGALGWRTVSNTWIFKCGSSLISEKYMLTAAHCSKSPPDSNLMSTTAEIVRLGDKNILDFPPRLNAQIFDKKILRIINYPLYKSPKKYYDIALIELEEPVFFTKYMMPACLWTNPSTTNIGKATLTGWGVIETVNKTTSPELQAAVVDVLDSSVCDELLKNHCNRHWCGMQEHQVCAGKLAGGVDACQGDSGGPLQVKIPLPASTNQSMHYVIGVTSFGISCARENLPGIYTRVSSFVDWIESVVWPDDL
ncbi:serine protease snake-like [Aricia agestis]|uniref:serine protease snake-like n=1 Tax=Aricia agestis TaxID=91739 RepID=UPI001C206258|nr:serine protease snake-like [Aricia agestis]